MFLRLLVEWVWNFLEAGLGLFVGLELCVFLGCFEGWGEPKNAVLHVMLGGFWEGFGEDMLHLGMGGWLVMWGPWGGSLGVFVRLSRGCCEAILGLVWG